MGAVKLETLPVVLGVLVALIGLAFVVDARLPDATVPRERRRRVRTERHRGGEALVGLGVVALGTALVGRDTWRFGTVAVLLGSALVLGGALLNRRFLRELLFFRGPARRAAPDDDDA